MNYRDLLADNLRRLRRERGMTQRDLARAAGLTRQVVAGYEQGRTVPHRDCVAALAFALGVSVEELRGTGGEFARNIPGEFGAKLRDLRRKAGVTQQELGGAVGVTAGTISTYECGRAYPQKKTLAALAAYFGVAPGHLVPQEMVVSVYEDEAELIARYRALDGQGRQELLRMAAARGKDSFAAAKGACEEAAPAAGEKAASAAAGEEAAARL